ncbi:MAG: preprotein translocase subunit SecY [Planctomycetaceae bacterium]|jgi:preprotein translocase subunit SecY|nr:preprotein translocase subunit SecY [Planctomycetaceae bacterium]
MFQKIRVIFSIPELRQKILLTLGLLAVYRIGWWIPLPITDIAKMRDFWADQQGLGSLMAQISVFTGTSFEQLTIFGLGIMPYISASIIFQLLATVWEPLEKLQKEGESGRKKINEYTRYATVIICLFQSFFYVFTVGRMGLYNSAILNPDNSLPLGWLIAAVVVMTAGSTFLMWLGEQIDEYGIGNGISLLIMAGILANLPAALQKLGGRLYNKETGFRLGSDNSQFGVEILLVLTVLFITVVVGVIYITKGQRRIPTQSAKHIRGRKTFGGNRQYLPLKVNQAGVMPIIFASSLLLFPQAFFGIVDGQNITNWFFGPIVRFLHDVFQRQTFSYIILFVVGIYFFCYFWTAVTFNPKDMAENLKNYGSFIPGYRPGTTTANYLEKVMVRITYVGASFLALIAILPQIISTVIVGTENYMLAGFFGGTSLLIVVSVIIDLVDKIDSHLVMRNYKGLLEKTK